MELPLIPLIDRSNSLPTPPSSRIRMPAVRSMAWVSDWSVLACRRILRAPTANAPSRSRCSRLLAVTVALCSCKVSPSVPRTARLSCARSGTLHPKRESPNKQNNLNRIKSRSFYYPKASKNNDSGRSSGLSPPRRLPVPKDSDSGWPWLKAGLTAAVSAPVLHRIPYSSPPPAGGGGHRNRAQR